MTERLTAAQRERAGLMAIILEIDAATVKITKPGPAKVIENVQKEIFRRALSKSTETSEKTADE